MILIYTCQAHIPQIFIKKQIMIKKIESTEEVTIIVGKPSTYVSIELLDFLQRKRDGIKVIYQETKFKKVSVEVDGETTEQIEIVEVLKQDSLPLSNEAVNFFFQSFKGGVKSLDNFDELQTNALLYHVIHQNDGVGRYNSTNWIVSNDYNTQ